VELDAVPEPLLEQVARLQGAEVVVGILGAQRNGQAAETAAMIREAETLSRRRAVLVVDDGASGPRIEDQQSLPVLYIQLSSADTNQAFLKTTLDSYQTIFAVSSQIGANACGVIASHLDAVTAQWFDCLLGPALELGFDLVAPLYARHKWDGLLNRSILSPLNRTLYGKRIQNPMGPDFGLSAKLLRSILDDREALRRTNPGQVRAPITSAAVCGNFKICQTQLSARSQGPTEGMNLSSLVAEVLGQVFFDMERNAPIWQRVRGSQPVAVFGDPAPAPEPSGAVDVQRMIESFQVGVANLQDVWSLVLPPTSLFEIRKLSRLSPEKFRMPDDLWVGIVFDFALAHRVRTISRDHLLRSFTPLYLGWVASYALEIETADPAAVEDRLERLARAYEAGKPYLVSRWRWPDRFNP
jgi:hypothetical protein